MVCKSADPAGGLNSIIPPSGRGLGQGWKTPRGGFQPAVERKWVRGRTVLRRGVWEDGGRQPQEPGAETCPQS